MASQAPRQNSNSHLCPPWCITDHAEEIIPGRRVAAHGGSECLGDVDPFLSVRPCLAPAWDGPRVQVHGRKGSVFTADADELAGLIEQLAGATPELHRALAAAIRQAAADITEAGQ